MNRVSTGGTRARLTVIILNYRTPEMTIQCARAVLSQKCDFSLVIVDNYSPDRSFAILEDWRSTLHEPQDVTLIKTDSNVGFSGGNNAGLRCVKSDYYVLLNSDTLLLPGALEKLVDAAEAHVDLGVLSPTLQSEAGEVQQSTFRGKTPLAEFAQVASLGVLDTWLKRWLGLRRIDEESLRTRPDWVSFACVLLRGKMVEQIGELDDGYFMYFEDADYCLRALRAGWRIQWVPEARVIHFRGGSSSVKGRLAERKRLPRYYYQSRARYFAKHFGKLGPFKAGVAWVLGRCLSAPRQWLGRSDKAVPKSQWRDIWINCFTPYASYTHPERIGDDP